MKPKHKSKTLWFSLALAIFGALYANFSYLQPFIDARYYGYGLIAIAVCTAILRTVTDKPLE